jgi:histone-lysine N-methyltransferase SETMAR
MIMADRRITVKQLSLRLDIAEASVCRILEQLGFSKVCARWVPRQLTDAHKEIRKTICADLLERHEDDGDEFLSRIVTGDETSLQHFEPETNRQSVEWHHANSPKKKFKAAPSAGKIMATIFWDSEGLLLVNIMPRGATINSEAYVKTLKKLHSRMRRVRPHRQMEDVLLLHDNARPHVSLRTTEAITKLWWTVLPHLP